MYDTILIPTDGTSDAEMGAKHGAEMAGKLGATVHALYVIEEGSNPWLNTAIEDQLEEARSYGEEITDAVGDICSAEGTECVTATKVGPNVHERVNEYVEDHDIDAIVMGSGYQGRLAGLLGSTAEKILRTSEVPVTIVRRGERK